MLLSYPLSYLSYSRACLVLFPSGQFSHSGDTRLPSGLVFPLFPSGFPRKNQFWVFPNSLFVHPGDVTSPCSVAQGLDILISTSGLSGTEQLHPSGGKGFFLPTGVFTTSGTSG